MVKMPLTSISLSSNEMKDEGAKAIIKAIVDSKIKI